MDALSRALHIRRYATFDCTIILNELVNVPLVSGRFKVKWRFSHAIVGAQHYAHLVDEKGIGRVGDLLARASGDGGDAGRAAAGEESPRGGDGTDCETEKEWDSMGILGSLSKRRTTHSSALHHPDGHGQTRQRPSDDNARRTPRASTEHEPSSSNQATPTASRARAVSKSATEGLGHGRPSASEERGRKDTVASRSVSSTSPSGSPRLSDGDYRSFTAALAGSAGQSTSRSGEDSRNTSQPLTHHGRQASASGAHDLSGIEVPTRAEPEGATAYTELNHHTVSFRRGFRCVVSIPVGKDGMLSSCFLKLQVKEEGVDEEGRRRSAKHGDVDLDLAGLAPVSPSAKAPGSGSSKGSEGAGRRAGRKEGKGDRRRKEKQKLLLDNCKTNASLKMEVQMDFLSGESVYKTRAAPANANSESIAQMIGASRNFDDSRSISMSSTQMRSTGSASSRHSLSPTSSMQLSRKRSSQNLSSSSKSGSSPTSSRHHHSSHDSSHHHHHHHRSSHRDLRHASSRQSLDPHAPQPGGVQQTQAAELMNNLFSVHYVNSGPMAGKMLSTANLRERAEAARLARKASTREELEEKDEEAGEEGEKDNEDKGEGKRANGVMGEGEGGPKLGRKNSLPSFQAVRTNSSGDPVALSGEDESGAPTSPRLGPPSINRPRALSFRSLRSGKSSRSASGSEASSRKGTKEEARRDKAKERSRSRESKRKGRKALGVGE